MFSTVLLLLVLSQDQPIRVPDFPLSRRDIEVGWVALFDGHSEFGWRAIASSAKSNATVKVIDKVLVLDSKLGTRLQHVTTWSDCEIVIEYRLLAGAQGLITVRQREEAGNAAVDSSLSRTDVFAFPLRATSEDWVRLQLTVEGEKALVDRAGKTLPARVNPGVRRVGRIELSAGTSGGTVEVKSLVIRPLNTQPLWNSRDLSGWKSVVRPTNSEPALVPAWSVKEGLLHVEVPPQAGVKQGGQGHLETDSTFADFILQLDVRVNGTHANSGVFFRGLPGVFWSGYESQIRNEWKNEDRNQPVDFGTGGIYRRTPARKVVSNDREFFTKTVAAYGRQLFVWVDGYPVSAFLDDRPANVNAREGATTAAGTISLQSHDPGTNLDFRAIRILTLPPTTAP